MATELLVQFSTSTAFASQIIRRLTHSRWSHVDIIIPGEGLLGVSGKDDSIKDAGGVLIRPFNCWPYLYPPRVARIQTSEEVVRRTIEAGRSQIGKPFDHDALWGFVQDQAREKHELGLRNWRDSACWFCSEWATWSEEEGRLWSYPIAVTKDRVSPADNLLLINPFMPADNIMEFL